MPLNDIISRAIDLNTHMGVTVQQRAVAAAVELLRNDADATDEARYVAVTKLIKDQATRQLRRIAHTDRQGSLFDLRERYSLDVDQRVFKDTDRLTELEFDRIIAIRETQLADDAAHLAKLREARAQLAPIWREYPQMLFGQVEAIFMDRRRAQSTHVAA